MITGGTRAGNNLFHSFGDFNIGASDTALFQTGLVNPLPDASVSNILARVTGGPSSFYGSLDSATYYPSADLFLLNPAGILFGPKATVNVGGMMTFTTADDMRLQGLDGSNVGIFSADTAQTSILTSAPVAAFGFIPGSNPGRHRPSKAGQTHRREWNRRHTRRWRHQPDARFSGTPSGITAPGGPIRLTSIAGPGEGVVAADTGVPAAGMALGTITLGQGTILSTAGDPRREDGNGGSSLNTRRSVRRNRGPNSHKSPDSSLIGAGGSLSIDANDSLTMTNTTIDASSQQAGGNGGPVMLRTNGSLSLTASFINTGAHETSAPGNGGTVTIVGKDVTFNNSAIFTDVTVSSDVASTPTLGQVRSGSVTITAQDTVTFSGSLSGDPGIPVINATAVGALRDAGSVTVTGKSVDLSNGSIIANMDAGSIPSPGNGGAIKIHGDRG